MRALLSRCLDRTLPDVRPDEMFFTAGPVRAPKPLVTTTLEVRPKRSRRVAMSRHGHPTV